MLEVGDKATRAAVVEVGDTWDSSLKGLFLSGAPDAGSRQPAGRERGSIQGNESHGPGTYLLRWPFSSVVRRVGAARREPGLASSAAVGGVGRGLIVAVERVLSVEELVIELNRELASFRVIVTTRCCWDRQTKPCHGQRVQAMPGEQRGRPGGEWEGWHDGWDCLGGLTV